VRNKLYSVNAQLQDSKYLIKRHTKIKLTCAVTANLTRDVALISIADYGALVVADNEYIMGVTFLDNTQRIEALLFEPAMKDKIENDVSSCSAGQRLDRVTPVPCTSAPFEQVIAGVIEPMEVTNSKDLVQVLILQKIPAVGGLWLTHWECNS
jgi:hypothetical protein